MRSLYLILITTLWCSAASLFARNGETGVLIVIPSVEVFNDSTHGHSFLICEDDMVNVQRAIEDGSEARIYLQGFGIYDVRPDSQGKLRLREISTNLDKTFYLISRSCHHNSNIDASQF